MQECPSEEHLAAYAEGICSKGDTERIGAHVEQCARCAQWVAQAKSGADQVREMAKKDSTAPESTTAWKGRHPVPVPETAATASMATLPQTIQGYEVVRELHRGGQGVVYQAVQTSTKRKVAIKVLLEGPYASKPARKRFEREIELVAQLRHPHIISIFDSGTTADGLQFYVMDYVRGARLNHYVREEKPTLEETLQLFETICGAVQFAHQRGIIHRDLKPSNILVDVDGKAKLLDFGLAKLVGAPLQTLVSVTEAVVGTLPYMSPEQTRGNPDEIDTRTDVYALGVNLYEILTGHYPYPVTGQMADVLKHIAETPPTAPSRSWTSDSGITRRSNKYLRAGKCPIDDELQTIILKALSKERERRYQSAGELAKDIGHYLADEPIDAKRDSGWYVVRKTLRRHRVPAAIAAVFVFLVTASTIGLSVLYSRAAEQQAVAQAVIDFLNNDLLATVSPEEEGWEVTVLEVLNNASASIGERFENQPLAEAWIRTTLGTTYVSLSKYVEATVHLKRGLELRRNHLGEDDPLTLESRDYLGVLYVYLERYPQAEFLLTQAFEDRKRILGATHPDTLISMNNLANLHWKLERDDKAEALYVDVLKAREDRLTADHPQTLKTMINLANLYYVQGRNSEAETLYRSALDSCRRVLRDGHRDTLNCMNGLARVLASLKRYDEAFPLAKEVLKSRKDRLRPEHRSTLASMHNLADLYHRNGDFIEAKNLYLETQEMSRRILRDADPLTLLTTKRLASVCEELGLYTEAEAAWLELYRIVERGESGEVVTRLGVLESIVNLYKKWGKPAEATIWRLKLAIERQRGNIDDD